MCKNFDKDFINPALSNASYREIWYVHVLLDFIERRNIFAVAKKRRWVSFVRRWNSLNNLRHNARARFQVCWI